MNDKRLSPAAENAIWELAAYGATRITPPIMGELLRGGYFDKDIARLEAEAQERRVAKTELALARLTKFQGDPTPPEAQPCQSN